jgi:hypothetical protein
VLFRSKRTLGRRISERKTLQVRPLERRYMLSLPAVADVEVTSTQWSSSFVDYIETSGLGVGGYRIPVGSSAQLQTLPWTNIDQIRITFSEDVSVHEADLSVSGVNTTALQFSGFEYDSNLRTAVWTLAAPIAKDKLLIDLDADGLDPVKDLDEANVLDGEWTNGSSTYDSGNGTAGGDFEFRFNVLPGDVNASNGVNMGDALLVASQIGKSAGDSGYNIRYDLDGNGVIQSADVYAVQQRVGHVLPNGDPAGTSNDAPTTAGFEDLNVDEDAADQVLSIFDAFEDAETADSNMTYELVSNSNPSLFSSTDIDATQGTLTLSLAENAFGDAEIRIRATDGGGLFVEATCAVHITAVNDSPVLDNSENATLTSITEDDTGNQGNTVQSIIDSVYPLDMITDVDTGAVEGIALVGTNSGQGTWQFSIDGGTTWSDVGTVSDSQALLLRPEDKLRFVPDGANADTAAVSFRAWDQTGSTAGQQGTKVSTGLSGGMRMLVPVPIGGSPFSTTTGTAGITVTAVNDAPIISGFGGTEEPGDYWTFSGTVTDVDDDVEGMIVVLGGVLESYHVTALVQADGTFSLTHEFPGLQTGEATAVTEDWSHAQSNIAAYWVVVS